MAKMALAIHGGAGTILRSQMTAALEHEYREGLETAIKSGWAVLEKGGNSVDAVEAAVIELEDFLLFNAGRGSVFTHEGRNEMDAAIMDGHALKAGAVAMVRNIRNPIRLARQVIEKTDHVLLAGEGANQFAEMIGMHAEPDEYFFTEHRWLQLQQAMSEGRVHLDHHVAKPMGTVGAVACDSKGHVAAATSTGGMSNKKYGRIGDSPLIGGGTYADDVCAVSCTGHGEYFMLGVSAFDVSARMRYKNLPLEDAANETLERLTEIKGDGGLIAVDTEGNCTLPFNSDGMYRGWMTDAGQLNIEIYAA